MAVGVVAGCSVGWVVVGGSDGDGEGEVAGGEFAGRSGSSCCKAPAVGAPSDMLATSE